MKPLNSYKIIDLETRSHLDLKKVGSKRYAKHPTTEVICTATSDSFHRGLHIPKEKNLLAWNIGFESEFIPNKTWYDGMWLAGRAGYSLSLDKCALELGFEGKHHGKSKLHKLSKPRKKTGEYWRYEDCPQDYEDLFAYCRQDVKLTEKIVEALSYAIHPVEDYYATLIYYMNSYGIPVDIKLAERIIELEEIMMRKANARCQELAGCNLTQVKKLAEYLNLNSVAQKILEKELKNPEYSEEQIEVMKLRLSSGGTAAKKAKKLLDMQYKNRLYHQFVYAGAITLRNAGRGIQPQNLVRMCHNDIDFIYTKEAEEKDINWLRLYSPYDLFASWILTR